MKKFLHELFEKAMKLNKENILRFAKPNSEAHFLDLGCDDGKWTMEMAGKLGTKNVFGIEIVEERARQAEDEGIKVKIADLAKELPLNDNSYDVIHANQVIEHVPDVDLFVSEIRRVLRPGGYVILSTENGSSWHNIFAALMGWQIFSSTNMSGEAAGVGNPLAIHRGNGAFMKSWTHKTIFNYKGLIEFLEVHGFQNVELQGSGYYPLPAFFGRMDRRHSHFITVRGFKI